MRRRYFVAVLAIAALAAPLRAADNPLFGTWKLNLAKSEFYPGPPPKFHVNIFTQSGPSGVKYTSDGDNAMGKPTRVEFTANFDNEDYPMRGDDRNAVSLERVSTRAFIVRYKVAGKITQIDSWNISDDGKTLYVVSNGLLNDEPFHNIAAFDKQ